MSAPVIYVALPVLHERENLEKLINCLSCQTFPIKRLVICINNYDHWWADSEKKISCEDNLQSLSFLENINDINIQIIDKTSPGKGWEAKRGGVGWARKVIMDEIASCASDQDIIISIDADTYYPEDYLEKLVYTFKTEPNIHGIATPYYHKLTGDVTDRLILRYEIYMRNYLLNMINIKNPYAYTAIGSAMAFPVWAYRKVGGLTPVKSGEDFYFMQKLAKNGKIGNWTDAVAYPSPRFSDRVLFGTGPALIKGNNHDWSSYPIYTHQSFLKVKDTFDLFEKLMRSDIEIPMSSFLKKQFNNNNIWGPLRQNYKDVKNFINACERKVDGLRILQYLRNERVQEIKNNETILLENLSLLYPDDTLLDEIIGLEDFSFEQSSIEYLNKIRDYLFQKENVLRKSKIVGGE